MDMLSSDNGRETHPGLVEPAQLCHTIWEMRYLTGLYIATHRRSLWGSEPQAAPASHTEWIRIFGAFCRRQIICNACAPPTVKHGRLGEALKVMGNTGNPNGVPLARLSAFEPWEPRQVDHVDVFPQQLCSA